MLKKLLIFSTVGAIAATLCDLNHVYTGTLSYPQPFFFNQAWWVFLGFVIGFFTMAVGYYSVTSFLPKHLIQYSTTFNNANVMIENLIMFMMVYLASGFGNHHPVLLSIIFYSTFLIRFLFTYERAFIFPLAIMLAISGMAVEGFITQLDLVHYRQPEIFGVPFWLGGVYMHGALCLREGMRFFVYNITKGHNGSRRSSKLLKQFRVSTFFAIFPCRSFH